MTGDSPTSEDHEPVPPHETLGGRYLLIEPIGEGASAITWRTRDTRLGRIVAVKLLRPELAGEPGFAQRFAREAQLAASIAHPNVVEVFDVGTDAGQRYIVMQYLDGEDLKHLITRAGRLPPDRAVTIAQQILAGLGAIHHAGIIHRDIKPQNVLIGTDGIARVTDFGVAHSDAGPGLTATGVAIGTAAYMAPEQAEGEAIDEATDIYAAGVVLYELLTGRLPFSGPTPLAVMMAHIQQPVTPPSQAAPGAGISPALDGVVLQAMAKSPADRFRSARAMGQALSVATAPANVGSTRARDSASAFASQATQQSGEIQPPAPSDRRWYRRAAPALALLMLVLVVGGLVMALVGLPGSSGAQPGAIATAQHAVHGATATVAELAAASGGEQGPLLSATRTPAQPTQPLAPTPSETPQPTFTPSPSETPQPTATPSPTDTPTPGPTETEVSVIGPDEGSSLIVPINPTYPPTGATNDESSGDYLIGPTSLQTATTVPTLTTGVGTTQTQTVSFTASDWQGAYFQQNGNLQPWSGLYAQSTGYSQGSVTFTLQGAPAADTFALVVDGMTSENWTALPIAIRINGQQVYAANSPFPTWNGTDGQQPWTQVQFDLPTAALRPGTNTVTFVNMVAQGEFSRPPYILLADGTLTVEVRGAG